MQMELPVIVDQKKGQMKAGKNIHKTIHNDRNN